MAMARIPGYMCSKEDREERADRMLKLHESGINGRALAERFSVPYREVMWALKGARRKVKEAAAYAEDSRRCNRMVCAVPGPDDESYVGSAVDRED